MTDIDLGERVATFRGSPWPWWASPAGLVTGAASIMFGLDGDGHVKSLAAIALGVFTIACALIGPFVHRRQASSVTLHRDGMRAGRPGNPTYVAWRDITSLGVDYQWVEVDHKKVPTHRMTIELTSGESVVLTANSCNDPTAMMRAVEQLAAR